LSNINHTATLRTWLDTNRKSQEAHSKLPQELLLTNGWSFANLAVLCGWETYSRIRWRIERVNNRRKHEKSHYWRILSTFQPDIVGGLYDTHIHSKWSVCDLSNLLFRQQLQYKLLLMY